MYSRDSSPDHSPGGTPKKKSRSHTGSGDVNTKYNNRGAPETDSVLARATVALSNETNICLQDGVDETLALQQIQNLIEFSEQQKTIMDRRKHRKGGDKVNW